MCANIAGENFGRMHVLKLGANQQLVSVGGGPVEVLLRWAKKGFGQKLQRAADRFVRLLYVGKLAFCMSIGRPSSFSSMESHENPVDYPGDSSPASLDCTADYY